MGSSVGLLIAAASASTIVVVVIAAAAGLESGIADDEHSDEDDDEDNQYEHALDRARLFAVLIGLFQLFSAGLDFDECLFDVIIDTVQNGPLLDDEHAQLSEDLRQFIDGL